jgi:hypothetical protein
MGRLPNAAVWVAPFIARRLSVVVRPFRIGQQP